MTGSARIGISPLRERYKNGAGLKHERTLAPGALCQNATGRFRDPNTSGVRQERWRKYLRPVEQVSPSVRFETSSPMTYRGATQMTHEIGSVLLAACLMAATGCVTDANDGASGATLGESSQAIEDQFIEDGGGGGYGGGGDPAPVADPDPVVVANSISGMYGDWQTFSSGTNRIIVSDSAWGPYIHWGTFAIPVAVTRSCSSLAGAFGRNCGNLGGTYSNCIEGSGHLNCVCWGPSIPMIVSVTGC